MQTTENNDRLNSVHASSFPVRQAHTPSSVSHPYQPGQPQVLTDDLKAQLAEANQRRRENLYPRLAQTLATMEQGSVTRSYSEERAMSLQQLAAANKARRSRLREAGYGSHMPGLA
ncbi:hypothetical protein [Herbaspirillum sp. RV1423]|uniref:hypothetical protein n=1 Tax=Herbaspirillum sp. RV1423 TaxID=1443993 RepID=UPI0004BA682F|nr:hypothetical protein [Herbaspirillum sp. RV1423]